MRAVPVSNRYPPPSVHVLPPPREPPDGAAARPRPSIPQGLVRRSIAVDSAATITVKSDASDMTHVGTDRVVLNMANNTRTVINMSGRARLFCETTDGRLRQLGTGKTIVGAGMHDLLSPSSMFADPDCELHHVHLEPKHSALVLHDGTRIPIRWDGRLFHLDYWSGEPTQSDGTPCATGADAEQCASMVASCAPVQAANARSSTPC